MLKQFILEDRLLYISKELGSTTVCTGSRKNLRPTIYTQEVIGI